MPISPPPPLFRLPVAASSPPFLCPVRRSPPALFATAPLGQHSPTLFTPSRLYHPATANHAGRKHRNWRQIVPLSGYCGDMLWVVGGPFRMTKLGTRQSLPGVGLPSFNVTHDSYESGCWRYTVGWSIFFEVWYCFAPTPGIGVVT